MDLNNTKTEEFQFALSGGAEVDIFAPSFVTVKRQIRIRKHKYKRKNELLHTSFISRYFLVYEAVY